MKYCCEKFQMYHDFPNTTSPNIRVVKFQPIPEAGIDTSHYSFHITMGYQKFSIKLPTMLISYCPFCRTNLKKFYKSDDYVNEFEGETFIDK